MFTLAVCFSVLFAISLVINSMVGLVAINDASNKGDMVTFCLLLILGSIYNVTKLGLLLWLWVLVL